MTAEKFRQALCWTGALLAALGCIGAELYLASSEDAFERRLQRQRHPTCLPYLVIPQEKVCGQVVIYINPDGSRSNMGALGDFAPMPRPPAK